MHVIPDSVVDQVRQRFQARLRAPVALRLYLRPGSGRLILPAGLGCPTCEDTRRLVESLVELAPDRLQLEVVDVTQAEVGEDVLDVPFLTLGPPGEEPRIRFLGLPAGFEFGMLVEAIERLSAADPDLAPETMEAVAELQEPVEVLVFSTPT